MSRHVCDCGQVYHSLGALEACQINNHGWPRRRKCPWAQDADGNYETGCGELFVFMADGVSENGFNYCPYCGNLIQEAIDG